MEKIDLMHAMFGKKPGICWNCHFVHWKIEGKGDEKRIAYRWCEVYGLNRDNIAETDWTLKYPACGLYNLCENPPKRNIWKLAKKGEAAGQLSLF